MFDERSCCLEDASYSIFSESKTNYIIQNNEKMYPIYIFCLSGNCIASKAIQKFTKSPYSHAAIGFDLAFKNLYSFNFDNLRMGGFSNESLAGYIEELKSEDVYFKVNVFFVREKYYKIIRNRISYYNKHSKDTKYDFVNLVRNVFKIQVKVDSLKLVCSEFVAAVCNFAGISIVNKPINLVTPKDLADADKTNRKVYNLYEGTYKDFSVSSMRGKLAGIKHRGGFIRVSTKNMTNENVTSNKKELYDMCTFLEYKEFK